jgi:hypothetical protein
MHPTIRVETPTWPDVVEAADWLRGELAVSKPLWGEACLAMGREEAVIAVAIVSTPGGYFHGMVAKAKAGELNLARTIWGLHGADRRGGEGAFLAPAKPMVVRVMPLALERRLSDRFVPELRREVFDALATAPRKRISLEGAS